jgi:hypothetical protein
MKNTSGERGDLAWLNSTACGTQSPRFGAIGSGTLPRWAAAMRHDHRHLQRHFALKLPRFRNRRDGRQLNTIALDFCSRLGGDPAPCVRRFVPVTRRQETKKSRRCTPKGTSRLCRRIIAAGGDRQRHLTHQKTNTASPDSSWQAPSSGSPPVRTISSSAGRWYSPLISISTMRNIATSRRVTK